MMKIHLENLFSDDLSRIQETAFSRYEMAFSQSKAVIFFILVAVVAVTQVYWNKKREVDM